MTLAPGSLKRMNSTTSGTWGRALLSPGYLISFMMFGQRPHTQTCIFESNLPSRKAFMRSHRWLVVDTVSIETFLFSALSLQLGYPKVLCNNCSVTEYPQKQRAEFLNASSQLQVDTPDCNFQDCIIGEQCLLGFKCFDRWLSTIRYLMEYDAKMVSR